MLHIAEILDKTITMIIGFDIVSAIIGLKIVKNLAKVLQIANEVAQMSVGNQR